MEIIQFAQDFMIDEMKQLWKECFKDSDSYIDFYYKKRFQKENTLVCFVDGRVASMMTMLPAKIQKNGIYEPIRYIYAVATKEEYRKRGYARKLLEEGQRIIKEPFILIPAEESLFFYYKALGFKTNFSLTVQKKRKEDIFWDNREIRIAQAAEYKEIRDRKFQKEGYIKWGEEAIFYAIEENRLLGGEAYIAEDFQKMEKDIIFVRKQKKEIEILEISTEEKEEIKLPKMLKEKYSDCENITFFMRGEKNKFAMSKGIEIEEGYFNLGLQ